MKKLIEINNLYIKNNKELINDLLDEWKSISDEKERIACMVFIEHLRVSNSQYKQENKQENKLLLFN
jgi:hypothetical protein